MYSKDTTMKNSLSELARSLQGSLGGWDASISLNTLFTQKGYGPGDIRFAYDLKKQRIEIRSVRAQRNANDWYLITKLFDRRIKYLSQFTEPIDINDYEPEPTMKVKVKKFQKYVEEMGENVEDYKELLPNRICKFFL